MKLNLVKTNFVTNNWKQNILILSIRTAHVVTQDKADSTHLDSSRFEIGFDCCRTKTVGS